jgi:uncharacterized membrane protein YgaE (UPF0421/DUF939 family)
MGRLRDPVLWTDGLQLLKTVGAAVLAWVLAEQVFGLEQPFLAPWAALLTVHATVFRTFKRGFQQVAAAVLGVVLAFVAGTTLGINAAALALVLLVGMSAGWVRGMRDESTTAAATALVVLLTGSSTDPGMLVDRLIDTGVGVVVGMLVNLVVWPPLRDRSAAKRVDAVDDRIGELLSDMATCMREGDEEDGIDEWSERTRDIDHEIDRAWSLVRQARESGRLNPRRRASPRIRASDDFALLLERLEQAVAETRSMARTVVGARDWDPAFRERWIELLDRTGRAITAADVDGVERVGEDIEAAGRAFSTDERASRLAPAQGALLVNLRNIADAMGHVATAQPVRPEAPAHSAVPRRLRSARGR